MWGWMNEWIIFYYFTEYTEISIDRHNNWNKEDIKGGKTIPRDSWWTNYMIFQTDY